MGFNSGFKALIRYTFTQTVSIFQPSPVCYWDNKFRGRFETETFRKKKVSSFSERLKGNTRRSVGVVLNRNTTFYYIDVCWYPDRSLRNAGLNVSVLFPVSKNIKSSYLISESCYF